MPFTFPVDEIALTKELISFARELPQPLAKQFLLQVYKIMVDWKFQLEDMESRLEADQSAAADQSLSDAEE